MSPAQALPAVLDKIDAELDHSLERLFEFLREFHMMRKENIWGKMASGGPA